MTLPPDILDALRRDWRPGAMYPSEIMWLYDQIVAHGLEVLIECGRQDGVSTRALGNLLRSHNVELISIDFDEDQQRLAKVRQSLAGLNVRCVSGDIHSQVPALLRANAGKRIGVLQDGPKGWEGLSTLLACAFNQDVALLAQHNLHVGHRSRTFFNLIVCNPPFLEYDPYAAEPQRERAAEIGDARYRESNRDVGHSSLGICSLNGALRPAVLENVTALDHSMGPWSSIRTRMSWEAGDFEHVAKLRRRQSHSWYRFKRR